MYQRAGHIVRPSEDQIPMQRPSGELRQDKGTAGAPCTRYKDSLKRPLKDFSVSTESWETPASKRPTWRHTVTKGATAAEERRSLQEKKKRAARQARAASSNSHAPTPLYPPLPPCGSGFLARNGFISHLQTHRNNSTWCHGHLRK